MESKKNKRRIISISKDIGQVSPLKEHLQASKRETKEVKPQEKPQSFKKITQYPSYSYCLSEDQLKSLNDSADSLRSIQLIKKVMQKSMYCMDGFFKSNHPSVEKAFKQLNDTILRNFSIIKQERVQRMKDQTVIYARPDKDKFEMHKTKNYNILLQELIIKSQEKRRLPEIIQQKKYKNKIDTITKYIKIKSSTISQQIFHKQIGSVLEDQNHIIEYQLDQRKLAAKNNLINILNMTEQMLEMRKQKDKMVRLIQLNKKVNTQNHLKINYGEMKINLFRIENCFVH